MAFCFCLFLLAVACSGVVVAVVEVGELPQPSGDVAAVAVCGLSAGAYVAVQFGTIFSGSINGVGVFAGG